MRLLRVGILAFVLVAAGCGGLSHRTRFVRVANAAMSPTYRTGDGVRVDLDAYRSAPPHRGDVVLFHEPQGAALGRCGNPTQPTDGHPCGRPSGGPVYPRALIERVSAVGGDWIEIRRNRVYLAPSARGPFRRQDEPFVKKARCDPPLCNLPKPTEIPQGSYFLTGDNRDASDDSRRWGPVPFEWLDGEVGR